jgi:membrane fusion protein (multidrug efflux system)
MAKRIVLTLLGLLILVGAIAGVKVLQIRTMIKAGANRTMPPETVTTARVQAASWGESLTATGSLEAVQGVTVGAELAGKVAKIAFTPGAKVKQDELLVQLDTAAEEAQLRVAETNQDLAKITQRRMATLIAKGMIAQADYDSAEANFKQLAAQADNMRAAIAKKTIRAPFTGRLGIRQVNLGQILHDGDAIVTLQRMDPIFVNFQLPQQELSRIRTGFAITLNSDALGGHHPTGTITTINPEVDGTTRNIRVQGTVANNEELLRPGMFATVTVTLPGENKVLTLPATAVLYAPYGDSVFVVEEQKAPGGSVQASQVPPDKGGKGLVLRQQFVRLGEKRGDFVAINEGVKQGETVVTTGVFKLRNGESVVVDNSDSPEFKLKPKPENN